MPTLGRWEEAPTLAMNRLRAYRQLLSRSSSRSSLFENIAYHDIMADKQRKSVPIVKLKIGESLATFRRGHTVAQLNNVRGNYSNYCHYRASSNGKKEFPPLQRGRSPSPTRDARVILMLRGTERKARAKKPDNPGGTSVTQSTPVEQSLNSGSQTLCSHIIVKRKETVSPYKSVDVTLATSPNSDKSTEGVDGYEIRGSSVFKPSTPDNNPKVGEDDFRDPIKTPTRSPSFIVRQPGMSEKARNGRFIPRPGSYVTNTRRYRDMFNYENDLHVGPRASRERKTKLDEKTSSANRFPIELCDRSALKVNSHSPSMQQPLELTQKNLQMFNNLINPQNDLANGEPLENGDKQTVNMRVLNWIQERQVNMAEIIQEVMDENLAAHAHVQHETPVPENTQEDGPVVDEEDPDLEVYDLTHHDDYRSHDEVIDTVVDAPSTNGH